MRKLLAWLGAATSTVWLSAFAHAGTGTALKPYVTLILDTSGSMTDTTQGNPTGFGPPSCGAHCSVSTNTLCSTAADCPTTETCVPQIDNKLDHAKCAIYNIANSYGDMVFALARFRNNMGGTLSGTFPNGCCSNGPDSNDNDPPCIHGVGCSGDPGGKSDSMFELLTPLVDGGNAAAATWVNFTGNSCDGTGSDPEIWKADSNTPLGGVLLGSQRYYEGLQPTLGYCSITTQQSCAIAPAANTCPGAETCNALKILDPASSGFDPILNDPTNSVFLSETGTNTTVCNPNPSTCNAAVGHCSTATTTSCQLNTDCPTPQTCVAACTGPNCCCASQCRPYIVILLTDGGETCNGDGPGAAAGLLGSTEVHGINLTSLTCAANVVTATTVAAHTFVAGNSVVIGGAATTAYNATITVASAPTTTTFTYNQTCTNGTTAGVAGTPFYASLNDPVGIGAIARNGANVVTVTTSSPHKLQLTQSVVIAGTTGGGATPFDGTYTVTAAPDNLHFSYAQTGAVAIGGATGTASHAAMLFKYRVETHPIGFGVTAPDANIEAIAHSGGSPDIPGVNEGYYASDQAGVELAISTIVAKSLRSESCNNLDDDCDTRIDEDFPTKGNPCSNGALGACLVTGTLVCRADGTGVQCDAGTAACNGQIDGTACSVTNSGGTVVAGTCSSGVCNPTPGVEICNGIDDDCDGLVDENLPGCTCTPQAETCNGTDQDCDNHPDQSCRCSNNGNQICKANGDCGAGTCQCTDLKKTCGTGTCLGTQTCGDTNGDGVFDTANGIYGACNAPVACTPGHCSIATATTCTHDAQCPAGQTCNNAGPDCGICDGKDNDCDGVCDGFTEACSNIGNGDPTNNPGDPINSPIPQNICHPGEKTCPESCAGTNAFGSCLGEEVGCGINNHCDVCDGIDNDCDNKIDEDFVPTPCSSNCGVGMTVCTNGQISCNAVPSGSDDSCDGIDEDCDGKVDEGWVCSDATGNSTPAVPCACTPPPGECNGQNQCIGGSVVCVGTPADPTSCCDCNGTPQAGLCSGGAACTAGCQCAYPCDGGEFPCPLAKKCTAGFCVNDPCYGVTCPAVAGNAQTCVDNGNNTSSCVDTCSVTTCVQPLACFPPSGTCLPNDCSTYPSLCTTNQNCINGQCVTNPCQGVTCPELQYCVSGQCYGSCADLDCPTGQRCRLGTCQTDPCGSPCPYGQACDDVSGQCIDNPCQFRQCPTGQWCNPNDGNCEDDPCIGTKCPVEGQVCQGGTCYDPASFLPDGGNIAHVTVGGGGCNTTGGGDGSGAILLGAVAMMLARRRGRS